MKYTRIEKKKALAEKLKAERLALAQMYSDSNSLEDFKIRVDLSDFKDSRCLKWFILYYHLKNWSLVEIMPIIISILTGILWIVQLVIVLSIAHCFCNDLAFFGTTIGVISVVLYFILSIMFHVLIGHKIFALIDNVSDAVWHYT